MSCESRMGCEDGGKEIFESEVTGVSGWFFMLLLWHSGFWMSNRLL